MCMIRVLDFGPISGKARDIFICLCYVLDDMLYVYWTSVQCREGPDVGFVRCRAGPDVVGKAQCMLLCDYVYGMW